MKIAVSLIAPEPGAAFESRFGRAAAFLIVDTSTDKQQAVANPAAQLGSGAGVRGFPPRLSLYRALSGGSLPPQVHPFGVGLSHSC